MKTKNIKSLIAVSLVFIAVFSCKQDMLQLQPQPTVTPDTPDKGGADFTKFVAVGNSFVAGVQGGALFTDGQNNSLPAIMAKQFAITGVNGGAFTQPTIGASLGYNLFVSPNPGTDNKVIGRMLLQYGTNVSCATGKPSPLPTPQKYALGNLEAVPNPALNPTFIFGNGSEKATLNNFAIPAIVLGQSLIPQTGNWAGAGSDPRFNPFYGRLAYPGNGTSTIIGDAAAAGGSFFLFWLGLDDFFLYAAYGADPTKAPLTPASGGLPNGFDGQYAAAVGSLLASNPNLKGVVGNFPDIFKMPHFTAVAYNPIPLVQAQADQLMGANAFGGYNTALGALIANKAAFGISDALAAEIATRMVSFAAGCNNKILMSDETLTDLGPYFDALLNVAHAITPAQRAGLTPYQKVRQTTSTDIIPLSTGSVLGSTGTFGLLGLSEPVGDRYVIIPTERDQINTARAAYNTVVAGVAANFSTKLALADVDAALTALITSKAAVMNGVTITPNIDPPTGIYSEDGVHPNSRGYAFLSTVFINAINAKFNAKVPVTDISLYSATALPIP